MLETIYVPNTVARVLTGKSTSWAFRAHFIIDIVLNDLLITLAFNSLLKDSIKEPSDEVGD